uniref:Uncharacterized protein n=2 Tax=Graphocephala atropunctata TaxID=36148 RepID=A0A1B6KUA1_9HEMI
MRVSKANANLKPLVPQNRQECTHPPLATPVVRSRSAYNDEAEEERSWERLRTTFSNKNPLQAPYMNFPECVTGVPQRGEPPLLSDNFASRCLFPQPLQVSSSTDMAVQVNIDHCADCRRHRKYGKSLKIETNDSDCDSESSPTESEPISRSKKQLKPFTRRRVSRAHTTHLMREACHQEEEPCDQDYLEETTTFPSEGETNNDNEEENCAQLRHKGLLPVLKHIFGSESPIANIRLIMLALLPVSLILVIVHGDFTTLPIFGSYFMHQQVTAQEMYLQPIFDSFKYFFTITDFPDLVSFLTILF